MLNRQNANKKKVSNLNKQKSKQTSRDVRFGRELGYIGTKCDTYGTYRGAKMNRKLILKIPIFILCLIWCQSDTIES